MSLVDKRFPFVVSHTRWLRKPTGKTIRHFRGYIAGTIKLLVTINRMVLDAADALVEEAYFEEEYIPEDKGQSTTRHFAFDVGIAQTPDGGTAPVLKGIEMVVAPACAHHYNIHKMEGDDFEPQQDARSYMQNLHKTDELEGQARKRRSAEEIPLIQQAMQDLAPAQEEDKVDFVPGQIDGPTVVVASSQNGANHS